MIYDIRKYHSCDFISFLYSIGAYEVQNADNIITFKISPDNKVHEVYKTASSVSAGDTLTSITSLLVTNYCSLPVHHVQQSIATKLHCSTTRQLKEQENFTNSLNKLVQLISN